jgi:hypothetical protein
LHFVRESKMDFSKEATNVLRSRFQRTPILIQSPATVGSAHQDTDRAI